MNPSAVQHYEKVFAAAPATGPAWLRNIRKSALASFSETGFPTRRQEAWKYTDVGVIARRAFEPADSDRDGSAQELFETARISGLDCHELPFINAFAAPELAPTRALPDGVVLAPLEQAAEQSGELLRPYFDQTATAHNPFILLNSAFLGRGAFLYVPDNVEIDAPIHLLYLSGGAAEPRMSQPRTIIVLGRNARARVVESYVGAADAEYFCNTVSEAVIGEGAELAHYKIQQESLRAYHVGSLNIRQARGSRVHSHSISLGAALARHDINVRLAGDGAAVELDGLYMAGGRQHVDHHTCIDHEAPQTTSREDYRGVLDGRARGVFNGRVIVRADAQKTDAQQSNANLLLSGKAEIDTKPELEIYADDVKCSHGATIGRLDQDMLFYLRTRAVSEETARNLLTFAFADDVIARIGIAPLRQRLEALVLGRLPDAARIREFVN